MHHLLRYSAIFITNFILLLSIEQIVGAKRFQIHQKYPLAVRQLYSSHARANLKKIDHNDVNHMESQNTRQTGMFNDAEAEIPERSHREINLQKPFHVCVKCPREITAVANVGLDGILVEPPAPLSCKTNLPFSPNLYQTETLFGTGLPFVLPQGEHNFIAKIRDVETGLFIRSCHLNYKVIVRRCKYPHLKSKRLKMFCTADNIWGSKCAFECRNSDESLTHHDPIVCNDSLKWSGHQPDCVREIDNEIPDLPMPALNGVQNNQSCMQPDPPANGRFNCDVNNEVNIDENDLNLPPGMVCKAECNLDYSIPFHLHSMSIIECNGGTWNLTGVDLCYKNIPNRHRSSRSRRTRLH